MTKSRKRMLLSSIAMLLVALVALGSATYAWFTVNKVVTANTMQVKAVAADGLVINNEKTASFGSSVSFANTVTTLNPVSYAVTVGSAMPAGFIAKDVKESTSTKAVWKTATDTANVSSFVQAPALPGDTYEDGDYKFSKTANVARFDMDVASSGAAINKTVNAQITASGDPDGLKYTKAALVTGGNVVAFYTDGVYSAIDSADPSVTNSPANSGSVQVMSSVPVQAEATAFQLYVWCDGNDDDCYNTKDNKVANFTVTFTMAD